MSKEQPVLKNGKYFCPNCSYELQFASNDATNTEYLRCPNDYSHCATVSLSNPDKQGYKQVNSSYNQMLEDLHDKFYNTKDD